MRETFVVCSLLISTFLGRTVVCQEKTEAKADPKKPASEIDAILYSDLSKEKMLEKLKPFIAVMDSSDEFKKKTGLDLGFGFGSGPGVMHYTLRDCGLQLVVDPHDKVRIIRRSKKKVGDTEYPQMSVSSSSFTWKGYARAYPD